MPLGKTLTLHFDGATIGELRAFVAAINEAGLPDEAALDFETVEIGPKDLSRTTGIEVFIPID